MRKTDKKTDNAIRTVLTDACENAKLESMGFTWLTHIANYDNFPASLTVICVYETDEHLAKADLVAMRGLIKHKLGTIGVHIKDATKHVHFDTEEKCLAEHNGQWNERLRKH